MSQFFSSYSFSDRCDKSDGVESILNRISLRERNAIGSHNLEVGECGPSKQKIASFPMAVTLTDLTSHGPKNPLFAALIR